MTIEQGSSTNVEPTPENSEGNENQTHELENDQADLEKLVNERLLQESKKYKSRAREAEKRLKEIETAKLQEQGQYKEMYEDVNNRYTELKNNLVHERKNNAVSSMASKYGCVDHSALLKLGNQDLLVYDDDNNNVDGVEAFVEDARRKYPYLFQNKVKPNLNQNVPAAGNQDFQPKKITAADIAKMPTQERMKYMLELEKQKQRG